MIRYAIVEPSGLVIGTGDAASLDEAIASAADFGQAVEIDPGVDVDGTALVDGVFVPVPPSPGPWAAWDSAEGWIDPRTPDDMWEELLRREAAASLPLYDFLMACRREGLLSDASATAFPDGVWPPEWEPAIADYTPEQMTDTALKMKTGGIIRRTDGIIQAIVTKALLPDQDMNKVFGVIDPYDD